MLPLKEKQQQLLSVGAAVLFFYGGKFLAYRTYLVVVVGVSPAAEDVKQ